MIQVAPVLEARGPDSRASARHLVAGAQRSLSSRGIGFGALRRSRPLLGIPDSAASHRRFSPASACSIRTADGGLSPPFIFTLSLLDAVLVIGLVLFFLRAHGERGA